ncbi:hypothetical protein HZC08_02170 [Candidatus Micrarchaeota archaeon]|nr:hypothetical protein [Candidatus Micrarchaeota archaeon]
MGIDYAGLGTTTDQIMTSILFEALQDWPGLVGALLMLGIGAVALIYMIGGILANDKIKAWAKIEVFELAYSVLILIFIVGMMGGAHSLALSLSSDSSYKYGSASCTGVLNAFSEQFKGIPCHIYLSMDFMNSLFKEGQEAAYDIYGRYVLTAMLAEMSVNLEVITTQTGVFAYNPLRGFFVVGNTVKAMMFDYLIKLMTIAKFQEILLRFVSVGLFPFFFSTGILLRVFAFTRKLGGLLMAIAISLFFILPIFYVIGGIYYNELKDKAIAENPGVPLSEILVIKHVKEDLGSAPVFFNLGSPTPENLYKHAEVMQNTKNTYGYDYTTGLVGKGNPGAVQNLVGQGFSAVNFCSTVGTLDDSKVAQIDKNLGENSKSWFEQIKGRNWFNQNAFLLGAVEPGGDIDSASFLSFFSLFFSFLALMATIAGIKSLSGLLGGDVEIAGLTHLI